MRYGLLCLLGIFPLAVLVAAPVPMNPDKPGTYEKALEKDPQLPVSIWAAGQQFLNTDTNLPTIAIGRTPQGMKAPRVDDAFVRWRQPLPVLRPGDLLERYWKGQMLPAGLSHLDSATLFLVGPVLGGGQSWGPARLTRDGQTLTLLLESWTDDAPRRRNTISRSLYAVDLGEVIAGEYDLRVVWRDLFAETGKTAPLYRLRSVKTGKVHFQVTRALVGQPKPGDGLAHLPTLKEADFRAGEVPAEEGKRLWQPPIPWLRLLSTAGNFNAIPASGLYASTFNLPNWLARQPKDLSQLPPLQPPVLNQPTYAVLLGPALNTGEWLSLREIEWQEKQTTLRVDLWRDDVPRLQNERLASVLVAPLWDAAGIVPAGDYTIKVEWSFLRAAKMGEAYRIENPAKEDVAALAKALRSKVEFTLK